MRGLRLWMVPVLALVLAAPACTGGGGGTSATTTTTTRGTKIVEGGVLRIGTNSTIDSINPFVAFNQDSFTTFEYIYPYLVQYDTTKVAAGDTSDDAIVGDFATSWEQSQDGLTWTFHTIAGAKWSDGQPLTAKDAEFTIATILKFAKGPTASSASYLLHVTGAEAPNDTTLVIHYEAPVANVLSQLQQVPVIPEHVWAPIATGTGTELRSFKNPAPVVSGGPFILKEYTPKDIALFERNPSFYGPKPHIDSFGLEMFRNDDAMIQALKNGDIDMIEGGGGTVPPTSVQSLKDSGFVVSTGPGLTENDFIINSNPKKPNNRELLDPKVKEAFAHAIDRNAIIDTVWQGLAQPAAVLVPPADGTWHDANVQPETFDLDLANKMLDDAGYRKGPDGIRVAGGHPMAYDVLTPDDLTGVDRSFSIIQEGFQQIGVKLTQKSLDSSATFAAITAPGDTGYLDFDLAMWDWVPLIDPDFILSVVTCDQYGGWSDTGYCNPSYDAMYSKQGTLLDPKARQDLVWKMQDVLYDDRPYIMLNYVDVVEVHTKSWDGFLMSPQSSFNPLSKETMEQVHRVA
ncbi:MAG: peptide ABC transporter substrate-binding protein [Actinomycetota bacterium]|nr:peptide ABC transporter substrate-binding protein [Actinomycetota bacterium]